MPNRVRPRCPRCRKAMLPVYVKNRRSGMARVSDTFCCREHDIVARGRRKVAYV